MANNLGQPTIQEVSNLVCGQCSAVICLGCPVYELDQQKRRPTPDAPDLGESSASDNESNPAPKRVI